MCPFLYIECIVSYAPTPTPHHLEFLWHAWNLLLHSKVFLVSGAQNVGSPDPWPRALALSWMKVHGSLSRVPSLSGSKFINLFF